MAITSPAEAASMACWMVVWAQVGQTMGVQGVPQTGLEQLMQTPLSQSDETQSPLAAQAAANGSRQYVPAGLPDW